MDKHLKKVVIYIYDNEEKRYSDQIKQIFGKHIVVEECYVGELMGVHHSDAVLIPSFDLFNDIKKNVPQSCEIIKYNRTITKQSIEDLKHLRNTESQYLVGYTYAQAEELIAEIDQLGLRYLNLFPATVSAINNLNQKRLVSVMPIPQVKAESLLEIDTLLDISTVIELGLRLGFEETMKDMDLINQLKESVTIHKGLLKLLNRLNKYEKRLMVLNHSIGEGYMEFDQEGAIEEANHAARQLYKSIFVSNEKPTISRFLDTEMINKVYIEKQIIENELVQIDGNDVVLSIYPTISSKKFYGASVLVKAYETVHILEKRIRKQIVKKGHHAKYHINDIIGESKGINNCRTLAKRMANSESSVVLEGETGTGKEVFAQAIHNASPRKDQNFVAINCAAMPETILESELFGYEEGAFTGSKKGGKIGYFELAHNGTIFLDEIGEMPKHLQTKLLRVLQEKELMRVGGNEIIHIDVRVIAATNKNLTDLINEKKFREDLYYRLRVLPIYIPPLRERKEDIRLLIENFKEINHQVFTISDEAYRALIAYKWKGNVRELKNCVEYLANSHMSEIKVKDLPGYIIEEQLNANEYEHPIESIKAQDKDHFLPKEPVDLFILKQLKMAYDENRHIGRRYIYEKALEKKIFVSEQQVRKHLKALEEKGIVKIGKGRYGCTITPHGLDAYYIIENSLNEY